MSSANLIALFFLVLSSACYGQQVPSSPISEITHPNYTLTKFPLPVRESNSLIKELPQIFLIHKDELIVQPDGTSRMYRVDTTQNKLQLIRQDSTIYFGSTFGCYLFSDNDLIYSFGGYGYWKYNGQLRVYVPQKGEWELEKLNREIQFSRGHTLSAPIWFSPQRRELWIGYSINSFEGLKQSDVIFSKANDSVYVLNLEKKEWETKGSLSIDVKNLLNSISTRPLASGPWGQLIHISESNEVELLDYSNNARLKLEDSITSRILRLMPTNSINHFVDSSLVIQSGENWLKGDFLKGDTVALSKSDFIYTGQTIYKPLQKTLAMASAKRMSAYQLVTMGIVGGIAISFIGFYLVLRKNSRTKNQILNRNETQLFENLFDDKEKAVIQLIKTNSRNGLGTNIEQINQLIGVNLKNSEVQKKQRSDVFLSINDKWKRHNKSQQVLIDKKRLEHDKRSYEYYIKESDLEKFYLFNIL